MSQRRFRIDISRTIKSVFSILAIGTTLLFPRVAPAQYNLDISFDWITADSNITIKGKRPMFPYPVMSLVTVKNQNGMYIHGLADTSRWLGPSDTTLSGQVVNDIWKTILEYHVEDTTLPAQNDVKQPDPPSPDSLDFMVTEYTDLGVSVALAMDFSASMADPNVHPDGTSREKLAWLIDAGKIFVRRMKMDPVEHDGDRAAIVKFDSLVWHIEHFTDDTTGLMTAIDTLDGYMSGTGVNLGVDAALDECQADTVNQQKAVVLLTDGRDHGYGPTTEELVVKARSLNIPIFTIGMGSRINSFKLEYMAKRTGGVYRHAETREEVAFVYLEVYGLLRGSYVLAHRTTDPIPDGTHRWVDIVLNHQYEDGQAGTGHKRGQYKIDLIAANVGVTKQVTTDSTSSGFHYAWAGDTVTYDLTVVSNGRSWAPYVYIKDLLTEPLTFVDYEATPDGLIQDHTVWPDSVLWYVPRLDTGDTLRIQYRARVSPYMRVADTKIMNLGMVSCLFDSIAGDNIARDSLYAFGRPDLTVQCVPPVGTASPGYPLKLQADVMNQGSADPVSSFRVGFYVQGLGADPVDVDTVLAMNRGDTVRVEGIWADPTMGMHTVIVHVDAFDDIPELNETNNEDDCTVTVGIDTLIVSVSDISLSDDIRGILGGFPRPVLTTVNVIDQNHRPVHRLANQADWLNRSEATELGPPVQDVWVRFHEFHFYDPTVPDNPDVRSSIGITEVTGGAISAVMAVDFSADLAGWEADIRSGLNGFVDGLSRSDWAAVVGFGNSADVLQPFTQDGALLKSALGQPFTDAQRRLYDGLWEGIQTAQERSNRSAILTVTGGEDKGSVRSRWDVVWRAREMGIPIFIIDLAAGGSPSDTLTALCDETGGMVLYPSEGGELEETLELMDGLLRNYYVLSHTSSDTIQNNTWRSVDVGVSAFEHAGSDTGVFRTILGILDVSVEKIGFPRDAFIQPTIDTVRYSVTVRNRGHQPVYDIPIQDVLPVNFQIYSSTLNPYSVAGNRVTWTLDSLSVGGTFGYSYRCLVDTLWVQADTALVNTLSHSHPDDTVRTANNVARDTLWYRPLSPADVVPRKTGVGDSLGIHYWYVDPRDTVTYTVNVINQGQLDVNGVVVEDILPAKVDFLDTVSPTPLPQGTDTLRWVIQDTLLSRVRETVTYVFRCLVNAQENIHPRGDTLINTVTVTWQDGSDTFSRSDGDTIYVVGVAPAPPQISVTPEIVTPGDSVLVRVMTPIAVRTWDISIFYESGEENDTYGDGFIAATTLVPGESTTVVPSFGETRMSTGEGEEILRFVLETVDEQWGEPYQAADSVTVRSADVFMLDENVFRPRAHGSLRMPFMLNSNRRAQLMVYDISGAYIQTVYDGMAMAGWNYPTWDGRDEEGRLVGSGIYVSILTSGDFQQARKFIIVR